MQTVIVSLPSFNLCVKVLTYREYTSEKSAKHTDNKEYEPDDERVVVDAYDLYDRAEHVRRRVNCGAVKTVKDGACNRCGYNAVYCAPRMNGERIKTLVAPMYFITTIS